MTFSDAGITSYTQSFRYDGVNRLAGASETNKGASSTIWTQTNSYDVYGNRAVISREENNPRYGDRDIADTARGAVLKEEETAL